jgi:hypothetical protein
LTIASESDSPFRFAWTTATVRESEAADASEGIAIAATRAAHVRTTF